jgi:hypothetical protein
MSNAGDPEAFERAWPSQHFRNDVDRTKESRREPLEQQRDYARLVFTGIVLLIFAAQLAVG